LPESIAKAFHANYEKLLKKAVSDETRKYRKQVTRLMNQVPRNKSGTAFKGENPTSDAAEIQRMVKFAIEHEAPVKIHYLRSSGTAIDEVIEPEALQEKKLYAFCPGQDEHHVYALDRIQNASI
jgi:predicted DNA-binding transcriptional regulator YafY